MTTKDLFEKVIKEHIKERLLGIKGVKVLNISQMKSGETLFKKNDGHYENFTGYEVECSKKARKYENNIVYFKVMIYDSPESEIGVYYAGEGYRE